MTNEPLRKRLCWKLISLVTALLLEPEERARLVATMRLGTKYRDIDPQWDQNVEEILRKSGYKP